MVHLDETLVDVGFVGEDVKTGRVELCGGSVDSSAPGSKQIRQDALKRVMKAHLAVGQSLDQGFLVDHTTSSRVDQDAPILHLFKLGLAETTLGLVVEGQVQADDIAPLQELVTVGDVFAFEIGSGRDGVPVVVDDLHAECQASLADDGSDTSHTDDPDSLALGVVSGRETLLPLARSGVGLGLPVLTQRGEDEEHGRRRRGIVDGTGGVGDLDPTCGRGGEVDLVVSGSVVADVLDGRREGVDDLGVEHADRVGRVVVSKRRASRVSKWR